VRQENSRENSLEVVGLKLNLLVLVSNHQSSGCCWSDDTLYLTNQQSQPALITVKSLRHTALQATLCCRDLHSTVCTAQNLRTHSTRMGRLTAAGQLMVLLAMSLVMMAAIPQAAAGKLV
jgi:hypothetical protein